MGWAMMVKLGRTGCCGSETLYLWWSAESPAKPTPTMTVCGYVAEAWGKFSLVTSPWEALYIALQGGSEHRNARIDITRTTHGIYSHILCPALAYSVGF